MRTSHLAGEDGLDPTLARRGSHHWSTCIMSPFLKWDLQFACSLRIGQHIWDV